MALAEWKREYSVNVQSIDSQHQQLFEIINELYNAMRAGNVAEVVPAILRRLVDYCRTHFADEENLMLRAKYPDYLRHKTEHDKLAQEVLRMESEFNEDKVIRSLTLLTILKEWIQTHILSSDKRYVAHLRAAGIDEASGMIPHGVVGELVPEHRVMA